MAIFRFGGPLRGRGDWTTTLGGSQLPGQQFGAQFQQQPRPAPRLPRIGSGYAPGGPAAPPSGRTNLLGAVRGDYRTAAGGAPQTGGGYQASTAPGGEAGGPNALEDLLRNRIRRIRTMGRGERTGITDEGLERGLGRSMGRPMEEQRQRETESVAGAERDFLAGEFESQRQARGQELQAELERARLAQQMQIERQRADLEMRLAQQRMTAEASQGELDRAAASERAALSGGGGEGTRFSNITMRRPGYGTQPGGFSGWDEDEARQTAAAYGAYDRTRGLPPLSSLPLGGAGFLR